MGGEVLVLASAVVVVSVTGSRSAAVGAPDYTPTACGDGPGQA